LKINKHYEDGLTRSYSNSLFEKATKDFFIYLGELRHLKKLSLFFDGSYASMLDDFTAEVLTNTNRLEYLEIKEVLNPRLPPSDASISNAF
jgi:hypothetical protein